MSLKKPLSKDIAIQFLEQSKTQTATKVFVKEYSFYQGGRYSMKYPPTSEHAETWKQHTERVERISYYLIGLCVALVGYSVHLTSEMNYHCELIFLCGALVFWTATMLHGLHFIDCGTRFIEKNLQQIRYQDASVDIDEQTMMIESYDHEMRNLDIYMKQDSLRIRYFFVSGILLFIIWRLFELHLNPT